MQKMLSFLKNNWFIIGLLCVIVIGFNTPLISQNLDHKGIASNIITILIFIVIGVTLPTNSIKKELKTIKVHLYLQTFIFIIVPTYFFFTSIFFQNYSNGYLVYGILALAVLPTTVSSCVIFSQTSGGNTLVSIFNSAVSNILGIFLSPILLSFLLSRSSIGGGLSKGEIQSILLGLIWKMLIPIIVGVVLQRVVGPIEKKKIKLCNIFSNILILLVVLISFSKVSSNSTFIEALPTMVVPFLYLALSHLILVGLSYLGAKVLKFSKSDTIATIFVAPQKTIALGVPMLSIYFSTNPALLGFALLPLLFYHPWQLMVAGFLRSIIAKNGDEVEFLAA